VSKNKLTLICSTFIGTINHLHVILLFVFHLISYHLVFLVHHLILSMEKNVNVNVNCNLHADFVGVLPCDEGLTSEASLKYVKDIMVRCSMGATKMIGMAFDGASSMKNFAMLIQNRISKHALYVHCFAHCNELVFKDAPSLSSIISDGQDFCENIYVFTEILSI
jgi:hypothetical protein